MISTMNAPSVDSECGRPNSSSVTWSSGLSMLRLLVVRKLDRASSSGVDHLGDGEEPHVSAQLHLLVVLDQVIEFAVTVQPQIPVGSDGWVSERSELESGHHLARGLHL